MKNKHLRNLVIALVSLVIVAIVIASVIFIDGKSNQVSVEITEEEAQTLLDEALDRLPNNVAAVSKYIRKESTVTVNDIKYGFEKNIILYCSYETLDLYGAISENLDDILNVKSNGNATEIQIEIQNEILELVKSRDKISGEVTVNIYQTEDGSLVVYLDDELVNKVFGGILDAKKLVNDKKELNVDGEIIDISTKNSLRSGCIQTFALKNYDSAKPDTSSKIQRLWNDFKNEFYRNFIEDNRWMYLVKGLGTTLSITAISLVIGVAIGFIVAVIRCTATKTGKLKLLDKICGVYVAIMRGTPIMIQLMIIYFVVLLPIGVAKFTSAVVCFGINSGAYVSEIVRGGIMSVDEGQSEAGRSLGFGYVPTMWYIVIPQAFKAILPSLANEFIALLKETSVAFYIGVADLTMGGLKIRSITYSNFMPLIAIALIYLVLVLGLSYLVSLLERRLRKSDRS